MVNAVTHQYNFETRKRKHEPEKKSAQGCLKKRKVEQVKPYDTKCVTLNNFHSQFCAVLDPDSAFPERIHALKAYSSAQENGIHDLYVRLDEGKELDIYIKVKEKCFKSKALIENTFKERGLKRYCYIIVSESVKYGNRFKNVPVLKMRSSLLGTKAELEWITKGTRLSGNGVLAIYQLMEKVLNVKEWILYDDSRLPIKRTRGKGRHKPIVVPLRKLKALSSPDAKEAEKSWYEEKLGYEPATCSEFPTQWDKITQDPQEYRQAIHVVRNTPLSTVLKTHCTFRDSMKTTIRLRNKYLSDVENPNVHQLVSVMSEAARIAPKHKKEIVYRDLESFFTKVIGAFDDTEGPFLQALKILEGTRIFVKQTH